jgi:hypothetical protein
MEGRATASRRTEAGRRLVLQSFSEAGRSPKAQSLRTFSKGGCESVVENFTNQSSVAPEAAVQYIFASGLKELSWY